MILSALYKRNAELCERMANAAKTGEVRQQWNELAAKLRNKADVQEGLIAVEAESEEVSASKDSAVEATDLNSPESAESSAPRKDVSSEPAKPSESAAEISCDDPCSRGLGDSHGRDQCVPAELPASQEHMLSIDRLSAAQSDDAMPEDIETADREWEELIAGIRSNTRSNKRD